MAALLTLKTVSNSKAHSAPSQQKFTCWEMFNLTVDIAHTFYVGTQGWLVHNTGGFPCFSLDDIVVSGLSPSKNKFTQVGSALQGHANRPVTVFPLPTGIKNPAAYNALGQEILEEILTNPATKVVSYNHRIYGPVTEYRNLTLGGVRVDSNGFKGLLDPNPHW